MNHLDHSSKRARLSVEWKILFALLALMALRLATIIAVVQKQL